MRLEEIDLDEWAAALPDAGFEVFHTPSALRVLDDHTDAELRLYGAFKGQEPVGLLPAFVESNTVGQVITSPPPSMGVPRLGPLLMPSSPKQRKRESVNRKFVDLLTDEFEADSARSLLRFECPLAYEDPRPFRWSELDVDQAFTYVLDLESTTAEDVRNGFSRDLRKEIRQSEENQVSVSIEGREAAERVYDDVNGRYAETGDTFPVGRSYFLDLVDALEERCRVYVARDPEGEYLGGIVVLYSDDVASFWQGGVRASYEGVSVNSHLHWVIIADVIDDPELDVTGYDLVGANTPRLCRYKSKFGAELVPYYAVESSGVQMSVAKRAYALVNR